MVREHETPVSQRQKSNVTKAKKKENIFIICREIAKIIKNSKHLGMILIYSLSSYYKLTISLL